MTPATPAVKGSLLNPTPKSYLTLSALGEVAQQVDEGPTVLVEDHGYALISIGGPVPAEAAVRDERDPAVWTELEYRFAWGDR